MRMALFRPGTVVYRNGAADTVEHVVVRGGRLLVRLARTKELVDDYRLGVEPTTLSLKRNGPR